MQPDQQNQPQPPVAPPAAPAPVNTPPVQPSPPAAAPPPAQPSTQEKPPFYRQYWPFGLIFILAPFGLIIGLILLLTGEIYKGKDGNFTPISSKEKTTLIIVAVALQAIGSLRFLR